MPHLKALKIIMIFLLLPVILFRIGVSANIPNANDKLAGLPAFMERGMADWGIPGMAVAVVQNNEMVYARGFGVRKLGSDDPVDENTIFGVASLTKAMTVAALSMLVDEGKLNWDDRVRDHLSWFELSDPWVSDQATISDLLAHRVGIGRMTGNRLRFMPGRDPQTIMGFLKHQEPEAPFRSGYVYSNMMYMVAGQVLEAVSGMTWEDFIAERLFMPLDMKSSNTSITALGENDNAAWPHQEIEGKVQVIPRRNFDNAGPAASVNASVSDMAKWMMLQLDTPGVYKGTRLISDSSMKDIFQPRQTIKLDDPFTEQITSYGFGWGLRYYEGIRTVQHSGATDGITSFLVLVPEKNLGVIVVSNLFCNFRPAVMNYILDAMLGIEREKDWHAHYFDQYVEDKKALMKRRTEIEARRTPNTTPSLPVEAYTGKYHHKVYDNAEIRLAENGQLVMQLWDDPEMIADLEHWHYDTFRAHWRNRSMREKFVTFDLDKFGEVKHLNVKFTLRQLLTSVGIYPVDYYRIVTYSKE
jgi:CubicO group peptidase (beta-lactamase class C family)